MYKNADSRIIDGPLSDQPYREHGNPLQLDPTRDDVGKKLGPCDRRRILTNVPFSISLDSFDLRRIYR